MTKFDPRISFRLLWDLPEKHLMPEQAEHTEYLQQTVFDRLNQGMTVDLAALDWDAFDLRHVTPEWYFKNYEHAEERVTIWMGHAFRKVSPSRPIERRFF